MKTPLKNGKAKKSASSLQKPSKVIKKKKDDHKINNAVEKSKISTTTDSVADGSEKKNITNKFHQPSKKIDWSKPKDEVPEKTDWNKFKKEKRELKIKRKEGRYKDLNSLVQDAKKIYEKLKCRSTTNKNELSEKLFDMLKKADCIQKFVLAHDTSRIIQCLLKHSSPKIREDLSLELMPVLINMMQSRYAHFCVIRMLKYGSNKTKLKLVDSLNGYVIKLCSHNIAGKIMDMVYFDKATKEQKISLRQEFYSDIFAKSKDLNVVHLRDAYNTMQQSKQFILDNVKNKLTHLVNKNAMDNSLVHEILLEYIEECREGKSKEECEEFLKICIPVIPHLISTKSGTKSSIYIFWLSQTKERRAIIKTIKDHLQKIITHEHGHQLIIAIVNSLDDTKAIKKSLFDPLFALFDEVIVNQYGRRVLQWFVSPADREIFHPDLIKFLEDGLQYSKKDKEVRNKEVFEQIEDELCVKIKENPQIWISNGSIGLVLASFLKQVGAEKASEIYKCIAKEITKTTWKVENAEIEFGIEDSGMHHVIKKIFKHDQAKLENGEATFAAELLKNIWENTIELWISKNRGCFVFVLLFEALKSENQEELRKLLLPHVSTIEKAEKQMGSQILLKKIKNSK